MSSDGYQRFFSRGFDTTEKKPNNVDIMVVNYKPYAITWGQLEQALWGVLRFCEGLCHFAFSDEGGNRIGRGQIYESRV